MCPASTWNSTRCQMLPQLIGVRSNICVVLRQVESCHEDSNYQDRQHYHRPGVHGSQRGITGCRTLAPC